MPVVTVNAPGIEPGQTLGEPGNHARTTVSWGQGGTLLKHATHTRPYRDLDQSLTAATLAGRKG